MTQEQYLRNLTTPKRKIDVVLDTDAYNEIDDQFAISYMLRNIQRFHVKGICAAPFWNPKSESPADGMEKSYQEILKLLKLLGKEELKEIVFRGSENYLPDETTPVESAAAEYMANLASEYSPDNPLYVVAIGAITNVASAILKNPEMKENCVVVWLGGNTTIAPVFPEFNMKQDIAAARIVFGCGIPLVQLPCIGVVDRFATSKYELQHWLQGKNALCDYLYEITVEETDAFFAGKPWTRVIWDVTAVAWLLNDQGQFMEDRLIPSPVPRYDHQYDLPEDRHKIRCVTFIHRDALFEDLFRVLSE